MKQVIGIIGNGIVGGALRKYFEKLPEPPDIRVYDPPQGRLDDLDGLDFAFVSVPVPTKSFQQVRTELHVALEHLNHQKTPPKWTVIRSTIVPGTTRYMTVPHKNLKILHMPEFLTERTADKDMEKLRRVWVGMNELDLSTTLIKQLGPLFPGCVIEVTTWENAETIKYAHNVFGALKVTFFNALQDMCHAQLGQADYETVVKGMTSVTPFFTNYHTQVPGPDGLMGFGGKCFPKDVAAFMGSAKDRPMQALLLAMWSLNRHFRGEKKIFDELDGSK